MRYEGKKVYIRFLEESDAEELVRLHIRNKDFFQLYTMLRNDDYYTLEYKIAFIQNCKNQREKEEACTFGIFLIENDKLMGTIALTEILRGPLQSCYVGYSLDKEHNGKGYMTEAVKLIVGYAFNELKLHRIEAGVMPHNIRSMKVLEKAGFHKEGIAIKNVKINGEWRDHQVLAIISEENV